MNITPTRHHPWLGRGLLAVALLLLCTGAAQAWELYYSPTWKVDWTNTLQYNLGIRVQGIDPYIGNNPNYSEGEYKFPNAGDIVTNRISDLSELDLNYGSNLAFRFSGSGWKDFAYSSSNVKNHPGDVAPGIPYDTLNSYPNNRYSGYTNRFYRQGAQLLDAMMSYQFRPFGHDTNIKVGRFSQYWGNSIFFNNEGIAYGQEPIDGITAALAPGTPAKALVLPRAQILVSTQLTPTVSAAVQYFGEWRRDRFSEGGTYLAGPADFLWNGPSLLLGSTPRGRDFKPANNHANFGVKVDWSPYALGGSKIGFYFRQFDSSEPWVLMGKDPSTGQLNYHLSYPQGVKLYGVSYDTRLGFNSVGLEVDYMKNRGLLSAVGYAPNNPSGSEGPTGDTVNVVANIMHGLSRTPMWDTGIAIAELSYTHLTAVTHNSSLFNGVHNSTGCPTHDRRDGCSTRDAVAVAGEFDPQWVSVLPGVNIDVPLFVRYGVTGNNPNLNAAIYQGAITYTAGIHALVNNEYNITLQYNGYHTPTSDGLTTFTGAPPGTPGYKSYYASGDPGLNLNDKGWIDLTLSASF